MENEKSINLQIEEFRNNLLNLVNNSGLPAGIVYYMYKDIGKEIENAYYSVLNSESLKKEPESIEDKENIPQ